MEHTIPRIVLAGTNSGCGKTTISCAILQALVNRGLNVRAFKCGPDYIDTMFHSKIIKTKSTNLDSFFFSENTAKYLLAKNGKDCDISIIEGVMGFYDGIDTESARASTYEISQITQSPVVLVVDAKGSSLSVIAVIQGFLTLYKDNNICGVILNRCSGMTYKMLEKQIKKQFCGRVVPLGYMPTLSECMFESRHLGLITASEIDMLREKLQILANKAEETIDIYRIINMAKNAPPIDCESVVFPKFQEHIRIAFAYDKAFCFYYKDNLDALMEMGAELVPFSPLAEHKLPSDINGIYFGGGYPELYAEQLSNNTSMLNCVKDALNNGLPCIAECGGFMYLKEYIGNYHMVGYLPGRSFDTGKLTRFGYVRLKAKKDNMLCKAGGEICAHEFHYWDSENAGDCFNAQKFSGKNWDCVFATDHLYAGYPHFHFYANTNFAVNFYKTCLKEKNRND
ncbi:MAG: cobyrinate a,c-diamide synthase [Clostridia bacterium]|nr:cobyrinate a,c-diamide synthase [Clostridia bacterium]